MWFWIALMAFFLIVFLMTKAVLRSKRGIHHADLQQGRDVSLSGGGSRAGDGLGALGDARAHGSAGGAADDGGLVDRRPLTSKPNATCRTRCLVGPDYGQITLGHPRLRLRGHGMAVTEGAREAGW